jgi:hypothetical protein
MKTHVIATVLVAIALLGLSVPAAFADEDAQYGGSLDAWKMAAHIFRQGNEYKATTDVINHDCPDVHRAITAWNETNGREPYLYHYELWSSLRDELWAWVQANDGEPPLEGISVDFDKEDIQWCTESHEDGWKVATDTIIDLVDDDEEIVLISINGETVQCRTGEVMMASATYYFDYRSGTFESGFGTNWTEFPGGSVLFSADIDFRCLPIYDPDTDIAEVVEAVPATQVNLNPSIKGLTGLDTWLWYDFSLPDASQIGPYAGTSWSAHGEWWTITTFAWVDKVMWDIDCTTACNYHGMASGFDVSGYEYVLDFPDTNSRPATVYEGGAEADGEAAFAHIYDSLGDTTVSTAAQWRGWYYVTSSDGDQGPLNLYAPVIVAESWTFPIVSVRAELRNRP